MSEREIINDPALYRRLSEPFPDVDAANKAITEFNRDVRAIREKHHIANVAFVMSGNYTNDAGEESVYIIDAMHGDETKLESMMAWGFGKAQSERQQFIGERMTHSIKHPRKGK